MLKNKFVKITGLLHRIFGKLLRYYRITTATRARQMVFGKLVVENRVFYAMPHHLVHHPVHHPVTLYHSVITGILHTIYRKKYINIYMFLNAYILRYIKETPWAPWCIWL